MRKFVLVFILVLSLLVPTNVVFGLAQVPDCPPGTVGIPPDCFPDVPPTPDPIVIVPGIGGSWNWDVLLHNGTDGTWDFTPFTNVYQPLVDALRSEFTIQGLDPDKYVHIAFYDWRQPNVLSAQQYLKPVIEHAKQESGASRVDIIAHSMGGVLTRAYIQGGHYDNDIDQFFTLGTPHLGSSDVYTLWEGGYIPHNWDLVQRYVFLGYFWFNKAFSDNQKFDFTRTKLLSIRDLLPTYDFVKDKTNDALKPTNTLGEQNTTLNTFNNDIADLENLVGSVTTIAGDDQGTVSEIPIVNPNPDENPLWTDGKPDPIDPDRDSSDGDNRVLLSSAHIQSILDQVTLPNVKHADLPSKAGQELFSRLGFSDPGELALIEQPDDVLSFMFASPVLPTVIAPNGTISKDGTTIPGAIYFGEPNEQGFKMILIPNPQDGEYKVDLVGNGSGHYDFGSAYFKQDEPEVLETFEGEVTEGEQLSYTANLHQCESEILRQAQDDNPCNPLETEIVDVDPPVITINAPEDGKAYRSDGVMTVDYEVNDQSTVNSKQSMLDGGPVNNGQTIDLSLQHLGNHTFIVSAADEHGNEGHATSTFSIFVTPESLKNNIAHYLSLVLIKNKGVSQALIAILDLYQKAPNPKTKQALKKSFETTVLVGKKTKLITPQGADLLIEQIKAM